MTNEKKVQSFSSFRQKFTNCFHIGTIFDLNGLTLDPPRPGPYGGVPCGGLGTGAIGRSYLGDFHSFSIIPGKYKHHKVTGNHSLTHSLTN